jgi:hypothetical protein
MNCTFYFFLKFAALLQDSLGGYIYFFYNVVIDLRSIKQDAILKNHRFRCFTLFQLLNMVKQCCSSISSCYYVICVMMYPQIFHSTTNECERFGVHRRKWCGAILIEIVRQHNKMGRLLTLNLWQK